MSTDVSSTHDQFRAVKQRHPGISDAYNRVGGEAVLGAPISGSSQVGDGLVVEFANGNIYSSPLVGAQLVKGGILASYQACGGPTGRLGFPTTDEAVVGNPDNVGGGWVSEFENGIISCLNNGQSYEITVAERNLSSGRTFSYRDSYADRGVVHQVFVEHDYNIRRLRRFGEIERFYQDCAAPLIVDCGANIGASAVWFSQEFPKAKTVAIEPDAQNFKFLAENSGGLNVQPVLGAIAGKPGVLRLVDPGEGEWGYRTMGEGIPLGEVRAYSIGEVLSLAPEFVPFILKVDIEGAEEDLFREEAEIFGRFPLVIIELHDWMLPRGGTSRPFLEWHIGRDRDFVHHGENVFSICNELLPRI